MSGRILAPKGAWRQCLPRWFVGIFLVWAAANIAVGCVLPAAEWHAVVLIVGCVLAHSAFNVFFVLHTLRSRGLN